MKTKHTWVAILTLNLTDSEAAQAYTFDEHGRQVAIAKIRLEDGFVDVGCIVCEQTYIECHSNACVGAPIA